MSEKKEFIKEKIVKKTGAGKGFRNLIKILAGAVIFGVVAACVFVMAAPYTQKLLGRQEETTRAETVTIPRDEPETLATVIQAREKPGHETESAPEDGELINDTTEPESTEPVEEIVQEVMEGYSYTAGDLSTMWKDVADLCDSLDGSVVTVRLHSVDRDIFDNERSHEGELSGIVVAETDNEIMILTKAAAADNEDDLSVELTKDNVFDAQLRGSDTQMGLAVVSISKEEIEEDILEHIVPVTLGNSYRVARGDMLLALGCPGGVVHSTAYGWVSYVEKDVNVADGTESHIYLDGSSCCDRGTWILNVDGQLIGWMTCDPENKDGNGDAQSGFSGRSNLVTGISEYKSILERMINAGKYAYLGLTLAKLPDDNRRAPEGLYVVEVAKAGPAYESGILAGDTLKELCGVEMRSINSYTKVLENLAVDSDIEAVVSRDGIEEYKEISYEITVGERP